MNKIKDDILGRYLSGQCSDEELAIVRDWIKLSTNNAAELFELQRLYDDMKASVMPENKIALAEEFLMDRIAAECHQMKVHRMRRLMRYVAAVVIIFALGSTVWFSFNHGLFNDEMVIAKASDGKELKVTLPDGTRVWLNKTASIKYPRQFNGDTRDVYLQGEAYFEVKKNPKKPFTVNSDVMSVRVLGTIFDFRTNKQEHLAEVSLIQGKVQVKGNNSEGMVIITSGQKARLDGATRQLTVSQVDARLDAVWHDDKIPFENANVNDICHTLEQLYGVKVYIDSNIDIHHTYSGVIKYRDSISTVLVSLQNTLPIKYRIRAKKVELISLTR